MIAPEAARCHGRLDGSEWTKSWENTTNAEGQQRGKDVVDHGIKLKVGVESQSVHFKNQDVLIYTHSPSDGEELTNHFNCCRSPKYWTKETGRWGNALNVRNLQQRWKHERKGVGWVGGIIEKALDEACSSCLCLSSLYFFLIYHMYVFFYQQRNAWTNSERTQSECMNVKGTEREVLAEWCFPFFFFFFFCVSF